MTTPEQARMIAPISPRYSLTALLSLPCASTLIPGGSGYTVEACCYIEHLPLAELDTRRVDNLRNLKPNLVFSPNGAALSQLYLNSTVSQAGAGLY